MKPTRIAIVGAGGISRAHVAAIAASGGRATLSAVVEPNTEALHRLVGDHAGAAGFASIDAFFDAEPRSIADGLILCTPPSVREAVIERAIAIGLPILIEKPLARAADEANAIRAIAKRHPDAIAHVGYCHRFAPAVVEIKRRLDAGELGDVIRFENCFAGWQPRLKDHWMSDPAISGGGSFLDTGCHSLDLFRHLIGEASMTAAIFRKSWPGRGESGATAMLRATSSAMHPRCVGVIESGWAEPGRFTLRVTGDRGSLFYDYERPTELKWTPSEGEASTIEVESHESRFERQLAAFIERIDGKSPEIGAATLADGVAVAELVDEASKVGQLI